MGRRYGRNQRRKARAEIARLEAVAALHYRTAQGARDKLASLEGQMVEWAARIVTLLGQDSAFTRELADVGVSAEEFRRHVEDRVPIRLSPWIDSRHPVGGRLAWEAQRIIETFAVYAFGREDMLTQARRFEIVDPDGRRALMLDQRTLHSLRGALDRELARRLMTDLVGPYMKGQTP